MPENEFEKKVSSEMQELKFKPSEKVWLHVEERIRKKKKRRVFLVIFLLAGMGLLGYWQWNNLFDKNEDNISKVEPGVKENKPVGEEPVASEKSKTSGEEENTVRETTNVKENNNDQKKPRVNKSSDQPAANLNIPTIVSTVTGNRQTEQSKKTQRSKPENKINKATEADIKNDVQIISNEPTIAKPGTPEPVGKDLPVKDSIVESKQLPEAKDEVTKSKPEQEEKKTDSTGSIAKPDSNRVEAAVKENKIVKPDSAKIQIVKDSLAVVKKDNPSKKWKWGLEFTPGISSLNENLFSFDMMKSEAADVFGNPSTGAGAGIPLSPPSESRSGFAFQIGAFAQKQLTPRSSFSVGLRYGYYSEHIRVGRDTVISSAAQSLNFARDNFYQASNSSNDKTNSYHFIEVPVSYHLQLNKNKQNPFAWDAGFTIGRLVATNAVMYDTAFRGIYYKQTNLLNKTQFSLSTGFSWTIVNNRSLQWTTGPAVDIHLNSLLNSPFEDKKFLFFAGLRSRILFSSKK